jgi:hypothetical protein
MAIMTRSVNSNDHSSASELKLVRASGLHVPFSSAAKPLPLPLPAGNASLHSSAKVPNKALSNEALAEISRLKARDAQVHQHEQAHLSAAAGLDVSNASFTYQRGPNGVSYAVAGEVKIDTSPGRTPEETLARAEMIRDAALAPADPSAVDRSVAAQAQNMAQQARIELMQQEHQANALKHNGQQQQVKQAYANNESDSGMINTFV